VRVNKEKLYLRIRTQQTFCTCFYDDRENFPHICNSKSDQDIFPEKQFTTKLDEGTGAGGLQTFETFQKPVFQLLTIIIIPLFSDSTISKDVMLN
jgi:hypothetical protein